jgi:hypothetical protein
MTEIYNLVAGQEAVRLEFASKDADGVSDYLVDFTALLDAGDDIDTLAVTIDAAGNGESPPALAVVGAQPVALLPGSPALATAAAFWLSGGTPGVRYAGKIKATGEGSPAPVSVKRFYIVVSK